MLKIKNPFKRKYSEKELEMYEFLNKLTLFEGLSLEELSNFVPYMFLRRYKHNEAVFFKDDPSHALYILRSGKVSLNLDLKGKFERLAVIHASDTFGENSILINKKRLYHALVMTDNAEIFAIPQINIHEIFNNQPLIKAKMMENLSGMNNKFMEDLFFAYQSSFGFFSMSLAYKNK
ncbi:cyclic nucleotide-binding domain-containing protein [Marinigracilibium pacificum]|uniref:cyclic nucleotide-binding domain-containing protein n=1 Tax=Marinigracilibium pacificum TaxID=2729599 RepID=UPI002FDFD7AB